MDCRSEIKKEEIVLAKRLQQSMMRKLMNCKDRFGTEIVITKAEIAVLAKALKTYIEELCKQ